MLINLLCLFFLWQSLPFLLSIESNLTFDEFFDYTTFPFLSFSPTGQHLLIQTKYPSWNSSSYENSLWIYDTTSQTKTLITNNVHERIKPQWSPNGNFVAFLPNNHSLLNTSKDSSNNEESDKKIYLILYSLVYNELSSISITQDLPLAFTWSKNDSSLYFAVADFKSIADENQWKDTIQYREDLMQRNQSTIYRLDLHLSDQSSIVAEINIIRNLSFLVNQLLYVPVEEKLIVSSVSTLVENLDAFELYLIDLRNISAMSKLTNNEAIEIDLTLSIDGRHVLFQTHSLNSKQNKWKNTQNRLYSLDLYDGKIEHLGKHFHGSVHGYAIQSNSTVYILGQLGTEVQIYTQSLSTDDFVSHLGWNGTYDSIVSSYHHGSIAFVYSSYEKPMEVYYIDHINKLSSARAITNENDRFIEKDLPRIKIYKWKNKNDHQHIEGILHYPPGKFQLKNLPLLVLIHGGPYWASRNQLNFIWHHLAPLAAMHNWLVFEPNYRGSTGYGDQFLNEINQKPLSLPAKDILFGIDQLIEDGMVDPSKLCIGGYSYGSFLTNWLITHTKRFNAALSGAGVIEYTSAWGTMDIPLPLSYLFGGHPWEVPHIYQSESPIYQLNRVRTPTLIVTGENDIRVPTSQSYIFERALYYLGVPVKLLIFPKEGHSLNHNPWHGKIKVREELKWLQKYGHQSIRNDDLPINADEKLKPTDFLNIYMIVFFFIRILRIGI